MERRVGKVRDRGLRGRFIDLVHAAVHDDLGLVADADAPRPEDESLADIAVQVGVLVQRDGRPCLHAGSRQ